jgi:hypothetical protein
VYDYLTAAGVTERVRVIFQDERNAADYADVVVSLPRMTERRADRTLRAVQLRADAPEIVVPARGLRRPAERIVCANEVEFGAWVRHFGGLPDYKDASAAERKDDGSSVVNPCTNASDWACGPEIMMPLLATLRDVRTTFATKWNARQQYVACTGVATMNPVMLPRTINGWDILMLYYDASSDAQVYSSSKWLDMLAPPCCRPRNPNSPEDKDLCGRTVTVDGKCYAAGAVNYALWGTICNLCYNSFGLLSGEEMENKIKRYKYLTWSVDAAAEAILWSWAGWNTYATSTKPVTPDRPQRPKCQVGRCAGTPDNKVNQPWPWVWEPSQPRARSGWEWW